VSETPHSKRAPFLRIWPGAILLAGLALRILLLPLPGTLDVTVWKIWAFAASTEHPARLYGEPDDPGRRRLLRYQTRQTTVDYPPLTLYVLAGVGRFYRAVRPAFPDGPALAAAVKLPAVLADGLLAFALWRFVRRREPHDAWRVFSHWWLGPAVLLNGAALGYLDPLATLPAIAAFLAAAGNLWLIAGALGACAAMLKAQAVIPLIALSWIVWQQGRQQTALTSIAALAAGALLIAPVVAEGAWPAFVAAMRSLTQHDMVSGNAANPWWLYTWVFRALYDLDQGFWVAFTEPVRILAISTVEELGHRSPKPWAAALLVSSGVWAWWRASARSRALRDADRKNLAKTRWALGCALGGFPCTATSPWVSRFTKTICSWRFRSPCWPACICRPTVGWP
jgi:hypothetical protein